MPQRLNFPVAKNRKPVPQEMHALGKRLAKTLKRRRMTAADLARASDTSPDQISRTITGETLQGIEAGTVAKWSAALGVTLDWLILGLGPADRDAVRVVSDGSAGVDIAVDLVVERLLERGLAVHVERPAANENGDE